MTKKMDGPILRLSNVNKSFGPIDVLHDISRFAARCLRP